MMDQFKEIFEDVMGAVPFLATAPVAAIILYELLEDKGIFKLEGTAATNRRESEIPIPNAVLFGVITFLNVALCWALFVPK